MRWQHPNTKKIFIRATDKLVKLRHRNADECMSQVVHVPAHIMRELRPEKPLYWYRLDILFRSKSQVELPEDIANYLLKTFSRVIFRVEPVVFHYDKLAWSDLAKLGGELNVYKVGMNKEKLVKAIEEATK